MTGFKPRFEPVFNIGHILTIITIGSTFLTAMVTMSSWKTNIDLAIERGENRAAKYIPVVEALIKSDDIQSERLGNVATALGEQRALNTQLLTSLGDIKTDLGILKARGELHDGR